MSEIHTFKFEREGVQNLQAAYRALSGDALAAGDAATLESALDNIAVNCVPPFRSASLTGEQVSAVRDLIALTGIGKRTGKSIDWQTQWNERVRAARREALRAA